MYRFKKNAYLLFPVIFTVKLAVVLAIIAIAAVSSGIAAYVVMNMNVYVNVPSSKVKVVNVNLRINSSEGSTSLKNVTWFYVPSPSKIKFKVETAEVSGNFNLSLSGTALIKAPSRSYRIPMPCIFTLNATCFRIMSLIPGWDVPMSIEPGNYSLSFNFNWKGASGSGLLKLKVELVNMGSVQCNPLVRVIGTKPSSTKGWTVSNGSTRSYSMLISKPFVMKTEGCCYFDVWIWFFRSNLSNITLTVRSSGETVIHTVLPLQPVGVYRETLVQVRLQSPGTYLIEASANNILMTSKVKCG